MPPEANTGQEGRPKLDKERYLEAGKVVKTLNEVLVLQRQLDLTRPGSRVISLDLQASLQDWAPRHRDEYDHFRFNEVSVEEGNISAPYADIMEAAAGEILDRITELSVND